MKYKGTYRLRTEYDVRLNTFPREYNGQFADNDIFIDCKNKVQIFSVGRGILQVYIPSIGRGRNYVKAIKDAFQGENIIINIEESDEEVLFTFNAKYMKDLEPILKPKTNGADRSPFSSKNLPKYKYEIPEDDLLLYKKVTSSIDMKNMLMLSRLTQSFLEKMCNKKYTMEKLKEDMAKSCLKSKEYIHHIGRWDNYIKYLEENLKDERTNEKGR